MVWELHPSKVIVESGSPVMVTPPISSVAFPVLDMNSFNTPVVSTVWLPKLSGLFENARVGL
jgi:hypothetical protein